MNNELISENFLNRLEGILTTQNQQVLNKVGELSKKVDTFDDRMGAVEKDINFIKYERPIERREANKIRRAVSKRVCELLDIPFRKSDRSVDEQIKYKKYSRKLFGVCYAEIPYEGHMAKSSYLDTPRGEYDATIRDIESFVPSSGMADFYADADKDAIATKIAREQGYE